jgi:acyl CoA:acetate/3-ketoacid CoA transferase beta subunit
VAPGFTPDDVVAATAARLIVPDYVSTIAA